MPFGRLPALAMLSVAALAAPSAADTTYQVRVSNHVDPGRPSCTVEVWAEFDQELFAFCGAEFDLIADSDQGIFTQPQRLLDGPGTRDGSPVPGGDSIKGIISGQIKQLPKEPHLELGNPVLIWRATWTTSDFTPRKIDLRTQTVHFEVYVSDKFKSVEYLDSLTEGAGEIRVGGCYADCDQDGVTDIFDFLCFVNGFNGETPDSECDGNDAYDIFDFLCFVNAFNQGC